MLTKINPARTEAWNRLKRHCKDMKAKHMRDLFQEDPSRFSRFSLRFGDILVDYSKNIIREETIDHLLALAEECQVKDAAEKMFTGDKINETEDRAVLHVALRNRSNFPIEVDGKDVMPEVDAVLAQMKRFSEQILSGEWKG